MGEIQGGKRPGRKERRQGGFWWEWEQREERRKDKGKADTERVKRWESRKKRAWQQRQREGRMEIKRGWQERWRERERETGRIERDGRTPVATAASEGKGRRARWWRSRGISNDT